MPVVPPPSPLCLRLTMLLIRRVQKGKPSFKQTAAKASAKAKAKNSAKASSLTATAAKIQSLKRRKL